MLDSLQTLLPSHGFFLFALLSKTLYTYLSIFLLFVYDVFNPIPIFAQTDAKKPFLYAFFQALSVFRFYVFNQIRTDCCVCCEVRRTSSPCTWAHQPSLSGSVECYRLWILFETHLFHSNFQVTKNLIPSLFCLIF